MYQHGILAHRSRFSLEKMTFCILPRLSPAGAEEGRRNGLSECRQPLRPAAVPGGQKGGEKRSLER
jgi:hypothetical protein